MQFFYACSPQSSPAREKESWLFPELTDARKKKVKAKNVIGHSPYFRNSTVHILMRPNSPAFPLLPPILRREHQGHLRIDIFRNAIKRTLHRRQHGLMGGVGAPPAWCLEPRRRGMIVDWRQQLAEHQQDKLSRQKHCHSASVLLRVVVTLLMYLGLTLPSSLGL